MERASQPNPDMPSYEYTCSNCGHAIEAFQSMNDAPLSGCPACGQPALRRRAARGAGGLFRGSGFSPAAAPVAGTTPAAAAGSDGHPRPPAVS